MRNKDIFEVEVGQRNPGRCPTPCPHSDELGEPMSIAQVARLLGCSAWTVRQRYLPQGLPHFRLSAAGKLVFFRRQVIDWIRAHQQKGGTK